MALIRAGGGRQEAAVAESGKQMKKKKVVVVGAGWAGLGAAHHLTKQVRNATSLCPIAATQFCVSQNCRGPRGKRSHCQVNLCRGVQSWVSLHL